MNLRIDNYKKSVGQPTKNIQLKLAYGSLDGFTKTFFQHFEHFLHRREMLGFSL